MSNTIVLKFGGSSQCEQGIPSLLNSVKTYYDNNKRIVLVISAIQKTTNMLYNVVSQLKHTDPNKNYYVDIYNLHKDFCKSLELDFTNVEAVLNELYNDIQEAYTASSYLSQYKLKIISYGELLATTCVSLYLNKHNLSNLLIDAHKFIKNKNNSNTIDDISLNIKGQFYFDIDAFNNLLDEDTKIIITQGFVASTADNGYCILTRSGSNTSASLIAAGLNAEKLEIWTDVSGLYTTDPRKVKNAKIIPDITYDMCQEAAAMGSQVIHPFSIKPCQIANIPIHIKNTFEPTNRGTIMSSDKSKLIDCTKLEKLKTDLLRIEYKIKFINDVINGKISFVKASVAQILSEIKYNGYPKLSNHNSAEISYNYILDIPLGAFTEAKIKDLKVKYNEVLAEIDKVRDTLTVYLITSQRDVTIFNIESLDMWESYGIASDIFNAFKEERIDINIITTSQFSVSTTTNDKSEYKINKVKEKLSEKYSVNTISNCTIVSVVADNATNNNKLKKTHALLSNKFEHQIYMIHYGSNNLSLSFVVDQNVADELIQTLHDELVD